MKIFYLDTNILFECSHFIPMQSFYLDTGFIFGYRLYIRSQLCFRTRTGKRGPVHSNWRARMATAEGYMRNSRCEMTLLIFSMIFYNKYHYIHTTIFTSAITKIKLIYTAHCVIEMTFFTCEKKIIRPIRNLRRFFSHARN